MKKILCAFLVLCLCLSVFAGCIPKPQMPTPTEPQGNVPENPYNKHLVYTMTDADMERFSADLLALEQLYLQDAPIDEIEEAETALEELAEFIDDQTSIANVIYCYDTTDKTASDRYLESEQISNRVADEFMLCARRIYESDAPNKDYFFTDWTDAEMERLMHYTPRVAELEQRNAELVVAYRDLEDPSSSPEMITIYRELVLNNNEIATIYGYDNYYDYAYAVGYGRDYAPDTVDSMRQYAQEFLLPACLKALQTFMSVYENLTYVQQMKISNLMFQNYDAGSVNYVEAYIQTLPETAQNAMNKMFTEERVVFTENENAREGAFTTLVGMEPFCFFGPGYQSPSTLVHELGHFYAAVEGDFYTVPLDLAETQSQGNEWLFTAYLQGELSEEVYECYVDYRLFEVIAGTLVQLAVDEFEEAVYSYPDLENITLAEFEALMIQVARSYGGIEFFSEYITDLQSYWKMVVVESPVYYISYAVSSMAALNIYTLALEDMEQATEVYCNLAENDNYEDGFLTIISDAGLPGPFHEEVYLGIYSMFP